jgi:hypothetical protein
MNRIKGRETVAMTLSIKAKEAIKTALAMTAGFLISRSGVRPSSPAPSN